MKMFQITIPQEIPTGANFEGVSKMLKIIRRNSRKFLTYDPDDFVLVHSDEIVGNFKTWGEAITEGYRRFGLSPFLTQRAGDVVRQLHKPRTWMELASFTTELFQGNLLVILHS